MSIAKKTKVARIIFLIMIILAATMIFLFSSQSADASSKTSESVTSKIVNMFDPSHKNKTEQEQAVVLENIGNAVRKLAHVLEFAFLGIWTALFCSTFSMKWIFVILIPTGACAVFSVLDEVHQIFVPGRSCQFADMVIDTVGAFIGTVVAYGIAILVEKGVEKGKKT